MTKVLMNVDRISGITYDCLNHSGDKCTCAIMSALTNVLVEAANRAGYPPKEYKPGHVRIDLPANTAAEETFLSVYAVIEQAAEQNPEYIKLY